MANYMEHANNDNKNVAPQLKIITMASFTYQRKNLFQHKLFQRKKHYINQTSFTWVLSNVFVKMQSVLQYQKRDLH